MSFRFPSFARSTRSASRFVLLSLVALTAFGGISVNVQEMAPTSGIHQTSQIVAVQLGVQEAVAAGNVPEKGTPTTEWSAIITGFNLIIDALFVLLNPLLMIAGWLMTPDWTFGEIFGLRPILHELWVTVANFVYIVFAFLLVAMAFMNIFGGEKNTWQIKSKLPKLIIGVVSVPFTWFLISAITTISSLLTASIIQLPADILANNPTNTFEFEVPTECLIDFTKSTSSGAKLIDCGEPSSYHKTTIHDFLTGEKSAYSVLSVYAYGIFGLWEIKKIDLKSILTIKTIADAGLQLIVSIVFFLVFIILLIAIVFALLTRAIMLWLYAIFSPLISLAYFFDGKLFGDAGEHFAIKNIISLALVPVCIAGATSFGLVFVAKAAKATPTASTSFVDLVWCGTDCQMFKFWETWMAMQGKPVGGGLIQWSVTLTEIAGGVFGKLIINIIALIVLWMAVMAALKTNKIVEGAVSPIAEFGNSLGKLMKDMPKYAPIIPAKWGPISVSSLPRMSGAFQSAVQTKYDQRASEIGRSFAGGGTSISKTKDTINSYHGQGPLADNQFTHKILGGLDAKDKKDFYTDPQKIATLAPMIDKYSSIADQKVKDNLKDLAGKTNNDVALQKFLDALTNANHSNTIRTVDQFEKALQAKSTETAIETPSSSVTQTIKFDPATVKFTVDPNAIKVEDAKSKITVSDIKVIDNKITPEELGKIVHETSLSEDIVTRMLGEKQITVAPEKPKP